MFGFSHFNLPCGELLAMFSCLPLACEIEGGTGGVFFSLRVRPPLNQLRYGVEPIESPESVKYANTERTTNGGKIHSNKKQKTRQGLREPHHLHVRGAKGLSALCSATHLPLGRHLIESVEAVVP